MSWVYDALGRAVGATNNGKTLYYQYDAASNRTRMTWPDTGANALYVTYAYDALNRVTQIAENGATSGAGVLATYAYDTLGRRSTVTRANAAGASTSYAYDAANRLYTLTQTLAGSASATYTFGYNAANQILTKQVSNSAYIASPAAITSAYTTNGLNQYTSVTGATATYTPGNAATLTYDPMGGLASETAAGATNTFLYDGANLVGEYSSTGSIIGRYVPGPGVDEPVLWYQGAGTTTRDWLLADNQGSIISYADQSGNSDAIYTYGPYGEPINASGAPAWGGRRYRFAGQVEIPEAQLYHYKARVYDPYLGRFYQTDPAGFGGGVNIYAYAMNDPINGWDPSGMDDGEGALTPVSPVDVPGSTPPPYDDDDFGGGYTGPPSIANADGSFTVSYLVVVAKPKPQSGQRGVCTRNPALDALGKAWSSPNSALGLAAAGASYAAGLAAGSHPSFQFGDNALQLIKSPINIDGRAYTLGNVQIYGVGNGPNTRGQSYTGAIVRVGSHEAGHSQQGQLLGPLFLPADLIGAAFGDKNPLEVGADKFATGKSCNGF